MVMIRRKRHGRSIMSRRIVVQMQHLCSALRGVGIGVLAYDGGECIVYCRSSWVICEDSLQFTYRVGVRLRPGGCIPIGGK